MSYQIEVRPYDPTWPARFEAEAALLRTILGTEVVTVHHIGSTSIPGIKAKPIIDILLEVQDIERIDNYNAQMEIHGFMPRGEYGLPRRRFFPRTVNGRRTTHVHSWQNGDPEIKRHLIFRDYMCAHPSAAEAYGRIKTNLAAQFADEREKYSDGKYAFVQEMERKAIAWHNQVMTKRIQLLPLTKNQLQLIVEDRHQLERELDMPICAGVVPPLVQQTIGTKLKKMAAANPLTHPWFTYWLLIVTNNLTSSRAKPPVLNKAEAPVLSHAEGPLVCGLIGFKGYPSAVGKVEIGYGIDPAFHNQGYATEAVSAIIRWAAQQPECKLVTAWTENDNVASQHVLKKNGFKPVKKSATQTLWETAV